MVSPSFPSSRNSPQKISASKFDVTRCHADRSSVVPSRSAAICASRSPGERRSTWTLHRPRRAVRSAPDFGLRMIWPRRSAASGLLPRRFVISSGSRSCPNIRKEAAILLKAVIVAIHQVWSRPNLSTGRIARSHADRADVQVAIEDQPRFFARVWIATASAKRHVPMMPPICAVGQPPTAN
jgi:hypothetical protein